jgi:hypothetical protein
MEFMGSFTQKNVKKKEIKHITNRQIPPTISFNYRNL